MKSLPMTALLFVVLFILIGCDAPQNEDTVQSFNEAQEWEVEKAEAKWYMKSEYHPTRESVSGDCEKWVIGCLKDFEFIKTGQTRADIMRKFPMDGGLQTVSPVRFVHPECSFFKVDVSFSYERVQDDQNRAVMGEDDKVVGVSKPYIENPVYD